MTEKQKNESKRLDDVNNERVQTTKLRVAHAIRLLENPVGCLYEGRRIDNDMTDIARAVNLLEAGSEEMQWACSHFDWNDEICLKLDEACNLLGQCLAGLVDDKAEDYDPSLAATYGKDALAILGKALATLIRWFDDDQDVEEV